MPNDEVGATSIPSPMTTKRPPERPTRMTSEGPWVFFYLLLTIFKKKSQYGHIVATTAPNVNDCRLSRRCYLTVVPYAMDFFFILCTNIYTFKMHNTTCETQFWIPNPQPYCSIIVSIIPSSCPLSLPIHLDECP